MDAPNQVIIFGASGDLTLRKLMPALARLSAHEGDGADFVVIGVSRSEKTDEQFRSEVAAAMGPENRAAFETLAPRVFYQRADVAKSEELEQLRHRLESLADGADVGRLFYLSLKPSLFAPTIRALHGGGFISRRAEINGPGWRRVVIEKPFGHDLVSARALNTELHQYLREDQIYRIDHYLGKETVQNLLGFRFHNAIFEPLWNSQHVELIQITVAEDLGMEQGRGAYYDTSGAIRDMLQNHMLQILSLVAMEPPASLDADDVRSEKIKVLKSLVAFEGAEVERNVVRARYVGGEVDDKQVSGYLDEEGVAADSSTETYIACRAEIENWRWAGVPILLRHGKRLPKKFTEVQIQFRMAPIQLFNRPAELADHEFRRMLRDGSLCQIRPNILRLSIQPRESIQLSFGVKTPGPEMTMAPAELAFDYRDKFGESTTPAYERLLLDALQGDPTLFLHNDEVEASWRFADSLLEGFATTNSPMHTYAAGSWGPESADHLFYGCEGAWSKV